jgi:hypothetical protein
MAVALVEVVVSEIAVDIPLACRLAKGRLVSG